MARTADVGAKVKKLEMNVKKLKSKVDALTKKLKADQLASKKKLLETNSKWAEKVKVVEAKAYDKGLVEALKFSEAKQKAIDTAIAKFDKEWDKKNKKAAKSKVAKKKKTVVAKKTAEKAESK